MTCSNLLIFFLFILFLSSLPKPSHPQQILTSFSISNSPWRPSQNRLLSSPNSTFAAGFRSLPSPNAYIFAVWFLNDSDQTVVWSINGNSPVGSTSPLVVTASGSLFLNDSTGKNLWQISISISLASKSENIDGIQNHSSSFLLHHTSPSSANPKRPKICCT